MSTRGPFKHGPNNHFMDVTIQDVRLDRRILRNIDKHTSLGEPEISEGKLANRCNESLSAETWRRAMERLERMGCVEFAPAYHGLLRSVRLTAVGREWRDSLKLETVEDRRYPAYGCPVLDQEEDGE